MRIVASSLITLAATAASAPARADAPPKHVVAGAKLGGIAPLDGLSPFVSFGIEIGAILPPMQGRLAVVLAVDYTQPTTTGTEMDPRVEGGSYGWKLTEQELGIMPVLMFRATMVKRFVPFGGIGPRVLLLRSTVEGGAPVIEQTTEQSTKVGVGIPAGVELTAGPGQLVGEALFQYGALDHTATGESHTGAISLSVGYRVLF